MNSGYNTSLCRARAQQLWPCLIAGQNDPMRATDVVARSGAGGAAGANLCTHAGCRCAVIFRVPETGEIGLLKTI